MNEDKILNKIDEDTRSGKMVWKRNNDNKYLSGVNTVGYIYVASFADDKITIYNYEKDWNTKCALEIIDSQNIQKYTFSANRKILDIYETVKFKTENVQESMEKFLAG